MKRRYICILLLLLPALMLSASGSSERVEEGKLSVVASFYPMYDFACKIGGDKVSVYNLVPSGTEPHDWEPSTRDLVRLESADLFIYSGGGMEHWVEDVLSSLESEDLIVCEASVGVALIGEDPHIWLDPEMAALQLENIAAALTLADGANAEYYQEQLEKWRSEFLDLDEEYQRALAPLPSRSFVTSHAAFGYLASAYGLEEVAIEGLEPDGEPDPARLAEVTDFVRESGIKVIFSEELASDKSASVVAGETGAEVMTLSPLEGLSNEDLKRGADYLSVMRENLEKLLLALSGGER